MLQRLLLIDNYDSFTWNLWYMLSRELGCEVVVKRNDTIDMNEIRELKPDGIILSPGPGKPENSNICIEIVKNCQTGIPILGVCLGHQVIGMVFGSAVVKSEEPFHGKVSVIQHDNKSIFVGIPQNTEVMRYHSLELGIDNFPDDLEISSYTNTGVIMGIRHKSLPIEGVQFHPESILSREGKNMLNNWLSI